MNPARDPRIPPVNQPEPYSTAQPTTQPAVQPAGQPTAPLSEAPAPSGVHPVGRSVTLSTLRGRPVIDTRGLTLGSVEDATLDPSTWRLNGLLVDLRKEVADNLHVHKPVMGHARLNVSAERIQQIGENVMLNVDIDQVAALMRHGTDLPG